MPVVSLPATKTKESYANFFDSGFVENTLGKASFVNENLQSKYKLGALAGLVVHLVPNELVVLSAKIVKSPDAVIVFTFSAEGKGTKITQDALNLPEGEAGDKIRKSISDLFDAYAVRFGGKVATAKKKGK